MFPDPNYIPCVLAGTKQFGLLTGMRSWFGLNLIIKIQFIFYKSRSLYLNKDQNFSRSTIYIHTHTRKHMFYLRIKWNGWGLSYFFAIEWSHPCVWHKGWWCDHGCYWCNHCSHQYQLVQVLESSSATGYSVIYQWQPNVHTSSILGREYFDGKLSESCFQST